MLPDKKNWPNLIELNPWNIIVSVSKLKKQGIIQTVQCFTLDRLLSFEANLGLATVNKFIYYMVLSHKDWELPSSRIWLAEIDIDRGLDFPI